MEGDLEGLGEFAGSEIAHSLDFETGSFAKLAPFPGLEGVTHDGVE